MPDAVIVDALRTPIGRYGGVLSSVRPDDLAARVVAAAVERNGLDPASVDEVVMGCTNQAGRGHREPGRLISAIPRLGAGVVGAWMRRADRELVTQARVFAALLGVATVVVTAAVVAAAEYRDDGPDQSQLFDVALLAVRVGLFIVLGLAIGLVLLWLRRGSAKAINSDAAAHDDRAS
jgi:acetyl-CoA acetyltransferase